MRSIDRRLLIIFGVLLLFSGIAAASVAITDTVTLPDPNNNIDRSDDDVYGLVVDVDKDSDKLVINTYSSSTGDKVILENMDGERIDEANVENGQAEFVNVPAGEYFAGVTSDGSWTSYYNNEADFPYSSGNISVKTGRSIFGGGDAQNNSNSVYDIKKIERYSGSEEPSLDADSASPSDGELVQESPVELSINASDADFGTSQGDSVNVTFYDASDGTQIGSDTLTANGTATTSWSSVVGGTNEWYAVASDSYGNSVQSQTFSFQAPAKLELRNESDPDSIVTTSASAEVTFFAGEQVITRTTTDGTIDMTGLPVDETFTVQVRADGFVTRQAVIESIVEQQEVYLLPDTVDSVESRFVLDDPTGQFAPSTTRVTVKKPITRNGTTVYRTVVADILGEGGYTTVLERDQRYLLEVKDTQTGNTRTLGPYVATTSETVTLRISALQFDSVEPDIGYSWGAEYLNQTDPAVKFSWGSQQNTTVEDLTVTITQKGGNKTVILDETYLNPGTFTETAVIPSTVQNPNSSTWLVEWQATIDGDTVRGSSVVGPSQLPVKLPGMSEDVMSMISVFVVLMVGGLFSTANVTVGGIITSLVAGGLWFTGALPDSISGLMIAAALFISIMAHARTNQEVSPR
jgi:hypothetical protein